MLNILRAPALLALLLCPATLPAWNETAHRAIACAAWDRLTPQVQGRLMKVIQAHPDYDSKFRPVAGAPECEAFAAASVWPDVIRRDPRFSDSPAANLPLLPGFPDMGRHGNWHFINEVFQREFRSRRPPRDEVNALTRLESIRKTLRGPGRLSAGQAYLLPWFLHILQDVHQPLHTVTRYRTDGGRVISDKGGNSCHVQGGTNLHSLWDGILGRDYSQQSVAKLAGLISRAMPPESARLNLSPKDWIAEGVELARREVYGFPGDCHDPKTPAPLPPDYREKARRIALNRAGLAAARLAAVLNKLYEG